MPDYSYSAFMASMRKPSKEIQQSAIYKHFQDETRKFQIIKYSIMGSTLLPVIFYPRIPVLRDNMNIGIRLLSSLVIVLGSYKIYTPILNTK